ncbi:hypothetical protein OFC63_35390, partial [Escherichia coli]|nr:hypothetical protein [Escherichia coli]
TLTASSADGAAFDFDENDGDDIQVTVRDQNGNPLAGQTVRYHWVIDPFATGVDNVTTAEAIATDAGNGRYNITFPAG